MSLLLKLVVSCLCSCAAVGLLRAEDFSYTLGETVSDGVPAAGAGRLATAKEADVYTFAGSGGQIVFFQAISQDPAFKNSLRWQLIKPSGPAVFSSFFSNAQGRTVLPEAGAYQIRVYSDGTDPQWIGAYSFSAKPVPPDQTFAVSLGFEVSDGLPAAGAGRLEVAGAEDNYVFDASAGDLVFFESISQDPAFKNGLRWELLKPSRTAVFSSFFSNTQGRTLLPETGQYRIRVFTDDRLSTSFGAYSFRSQRIPPDQTFAYSIGSPVSDGVPAAGAGKLEAPGAIDIYPFTATAGQVVFFESGSQDAAFKRSLRWELLKPSGAAVFSSFFSNAQGRTVLPEAGQYRIRIFTDGKDPTMVGTYSFSTRGDVSDQVFPIRVGDVVSDGKPATGAGRIETPGSEDTYSFSARAGQVVIFESVGQDAAFQGNLRWQLTKPSGGALFSSFFGNAQGRTVLPEAGTYTIRVFTGADNPSWIGVYSFRTYSTVRAYADSLATEPDKQLVVPTAKLLFNDQAEETTDVLSLVVESATTAEGGTITTAADTLSYRPKAGFTGTDHFAYTLHGAMGGTNQATVTVAVGPEILKAATIVSWIRQETGSATVLLLGDLMTDYILERSQDLTIWTDAGGTVTTDAAGFATFTLEPTTNPDRQFYRARRKP